MRVTNSRFGSRFSRRNIQRRANAIELLEPRQLLSGTIASGQTITASLTRVGQLDAYTFSAAAGSSFEVSLGDATATSTYHPYLQVAAPNTTRIINDTSGGGFANRADVDFYTVPAGAGGTYTITVQDYSASGTGAYALELIKVPGGIGTDSNADGGKISNGQTKTGTINRYGDLDAFTFTAPAGSSFELSLGDSTTTSTYAPYLQVLAPDGSRVINDTSGSGFANRADKDFYTVPTTAAGTYTVIVHDYNLTATGGTYSLELVQAPGTIAADSNGNGGAIANGQTKTGTINRYGDLDAFTFSAPAGGSFELSLGDSTTTSTYAPYLQVLSPSGSRVINDTSGAGFTKRADSDFYTVPAAAGGTYTVIVSDYNQTDTGGAYSLELIQVPGSIGADANGDGGPITSGQTKNGTINRYGDLDAFTFSASVGDNFEVSVGDTTAASTYAPYLQLIGPTGTRVINDTSGGGFTNRSVSDSYKVPTGAAGNYTIIVEDYNQTDTGGAYTLQLNGTIHPTTPTITVTAPAAQTATAGVSKTFTLGKFSESNATGPYTVDVKWGDGTADTKFTATSPGTIAGKAHTYAKVGSDTVTIIVTDAKGHVSKSATFKVTVTAPLGSIAGTVYGDSNGNGKFDPSELGLGLWKVYIDTNNDGKLDNGESSVTTDVNGAWSFKSLKAGTYVVRVVQVAKTASTTPSTGMLKIVVGAGANLTGELFGEKRIA